MKNIHTTSIWVRLLCALFLSFFASFAFAGEVVVQKGDTLSKLADKNKYEGGWKALWELNKVAVKNPNLIFPGQVLRTPEVTPVAARKEETLAPVAQVKVQKVVSTLVADPMPVITKIDIAPLAAELPVAAISVAEKVEAIAVAPAAPTVVSTAIEALPAAKPAEVADTVRDAQSSMNLAQGPPPIAEPPVTKIVEPSPTEVVAVNPDAKVSTAPKATAPAATISVVDEFNDIRNWKPVFGGAESSINFGAQQSAPVKKEAAAKSLRDEFGDPNSWKIVPITANPFVSSQIQQSSISPDAQVAQAQPR